MVSHIKVKDQNTQRQKRKSRNMYVAEGNTTGRQFQSPSVKIAQQTLISIDEFEDKHKFAFLSPQCDSRNINLSQLPSIDQRRISVAHQTQQNMLSPRSSVFDKKDMMNNRQHTMMGSLNDSILQDMKQKQNILKNKDNLDFTELKVKLNQKRKDIVNTSVC